MNIKFIHSLIIMSLLPSTVLIINMQHLILHKLVLRRVQSEVEHAWPRVLYYVLLRWDRDARGVTLWFLLQNGLAGFLGIQSIVGWDWNWCWTSAEWNWFAYILGWGVMIRWWFQRDAQRCSLRWWSCASDGWCGGEPLLSPLLMFLPLVL